MDALVHEEKAVLSITSDDVEQARAFKAEVEQARGDVATGKHESITVGLHGGRSVEMPPELTSLVSQVLDLLGRGCTVTVGSIPNEVTTTIAAKMLSISRPTLMKLINQGEISAHKVGSHTRLFSKDVIAYRDEQRDAQREAFQQLRELEDQLGLDD